MKLFATSFISAVLALSAVTSFAAGDAKPEPAKAAKPVAYKPDLVKGEASFASCVACHGVGGNSGTPVNPKLAHHDGVGALTRLKFY